jgi:hypothetical protein
MSDEHGDDTARVQVSASSASRKDLPAWFAEALVLLSMWKNSRLVEALEGLRWTRGSKRFEVVDMILVLLLLVVSNARSVRGFFKVVADHKVEFAALAALWGRERLPTRSGFLGMLQAVEPDLLAQVVPLFCPI